MRARAAAFVLVTVLLSACDVLGSGEDGDEFETYSFKYALALPVDTVEGIPRWTVTDPSGVPCAGVPDPASFPLLLAVLQSGTDFDNNIENCGGLFLVAGAAVDDVRDNGLPFDYRTAGGNNAVIRANRLSFDPVIDPRSMTISTSGGLTVDVKTTFGLASVGFTDPDRQFECENGGPDWAENFSVPDATFFEMTITDQGGGRAEGTFQCVGRSISDPEDGRLLLVVDGAFSMVVR